jgi:hypothetical protein
LIAQTTTATVSPEERAAVALEKIEKAATRMADAAEKMAAPAVAAEKAADPKKVDGPEWSGSVGVGLIWLAGNSETLTFSGNAAAAVKLTDWIFGLKLSAAYGQTVAPGMEELDLDPTVVAYNAAAQLRGDRRFTETVTGYLLAGVETDRVKSISSRTYGELGASLTWFEEKKEDFVLSSLRTDLGIRYTVEDQFQFYPEEMEIEEGDLGKMLAPRLGVAFRYAVSESLIFTEDLEVLPNVLHETRVFLTSTSKIAMRLTQVLSFGVALGIAYDSLPVADKEKLDSALTAGLEVAF